MIAALLDHLWQSSLVAGAAALLTLTLRRNGARVRFWLWLCASVKFLIPFSALAALGGVAARLCPVAITVPRLLALQPAEPFLVPMRAVPLNAGESHALVPLPLAVWGLGIAAVLGLRLVHGTRLRRIVGAARDVALALPGAASLRVKASASLLEPGLVGIWKPVILLPEGLMARLSQAELDAILAHELTHLARRDNLAAAIHMLVEALFWFYPPVWLIGARLIAEREKACDESVLGSGHDPQAYARGILKVCKFCIQSPLACAAGATGADLGRRVELIMTGDAAHDLGAAKKILLAGAAAFVLAAPVMTGFLASPLTIDVRKTVVTVQVRAQAVLTRNVAVLAQEIGAVPVARVEVRKLPRLAMATLPAVMPLLPPTPVTPATIVPPVVQAAPRKMDVPRVTAASALKEVLFALDPRGEGDPDAITCRTPQALPGSRLPGPEVCQFNRDWAQLYKSHQVIGEDGKTAMAANGRYSPVCVRDLTQSGSMPAIARTGGPIFITACY